MPTQTKQQAAIQAAQDLNALMAKFKDCRDSAAAFVVRYNSEGYSTTWGNMTTAAQSTDGSLGAQDGSPVAANPIAVGGIFRSKNALVAAVNVCIDFASFCGNAAVATAQRSQSIDDIAS